MYYSLDEAKIKIIEAGHKLLEEGLVARTWGNISARISKDEFVITPSGRSYEDLKPEDLVVIKVADASYTGDIKPSSERILHSACYKLRDECSFIIHTHQLYATVISVSGKNFDFAPCADYALSGTQKLADAVAKAVDANKSSKAFLMQRHGAVLLGNSVEDAFNLAHTLECAAEAEFLKLMNLAEKPENLHYYFESAKAITKDLKAYIDDFAQILGPKVDISKSLNAICVGEDAWAEEYILMKNCAAFLYSSKLKAKPLGFLDAKLQRIGYLNSYSKLKNQNKKA